MKTKQIFTLIALLALAGGSGSHGYAAGVRGGFALAGGGGVKPFIQVSGGGSHGGNALSGGFERGFASREKAGNGFSSGNGPGNGFAIDGGNGSHGIIKGFEKGLSGGGIGKGFADGGVEKGFFGGDGTGI